MKIVTRLALLVCTLVIALMMTGCGGGGGGGTNPFTYFKASNTDTGDEFGRSVALSDDGATLAVGAYHEDSDGVTVPIESNNSATAAGAVYVFTSVGGWQQQAYVKAPTPAAYDWFGFSVALSADGNTLAVGAPQYPASSGVVYVYTRSGSTWTFKQQMTAGASGDGFGWAVALSDDGSVLAVGAPFESTSASSSGALYVYTTIDSWSNVATTNSIKSSGAASEANAQLGVSVALNGAGDVLAGGANQISSAGPGFVKIYKPTGGGGDVWATQSEVSVTAADGELDDQFGVSVSLNTAGDMLAVGAWQEDSNTITDTTNNGAADSGAAYVFVTADNWATAPTETYVKASSPVANDNFGTSVSLNGSGDTLSVGAPFAASTGTAYRVVNNGTWAGGIASEQAITPPSGDNGDQFGFSVSLSASAGRLAIGDNYEDSAATGINGDKTDNSKPDSGAAYVYVP
jgi:hypothetical protein